LLEIDVIVKEDIKFLPLLNRAVDIVYSDLSHKSQQVVPRDYALNEFIKTATNSICYYLEDKERNCFLFAMVEEGHTTPHYVGKGSAVQALVVNKYDYRMMRSFLKVLTSGCKLRGETWLWYSHRVSDGNYKIKYKVI